MGPETHAARGEAGTGPGPVPAAAARCPHCAGAVRPTAPWCTQCWADLRPAPVPAPQPATSSPTSSPTRGLGGWPCGGCGHVNAVELDVCSACGSGFLVGLRTDEPPLLVLPGLGDVTRLSRAQRIGTACGAVLVVLVLVALLSLLTG